MGLSLATPPSRLTFAEMLAQLYADRHTGPIILHFAEGHVHVIELPAESTRIVLDKTVAVRAGLTASLDSRG